jgi:hypothetical protein
MRVKRCISLYGERMVVSVSHTWFNSWMAEALFSLSLVKHNFKKSLADSETFLNSGYSRFRSCSTIAF